MKLFKFKKMSPLFWISMATAFLGFIAAIVQQNEDLKRERVANEANKKLLEKSEEINRTQKETINQLTGGDKMVELIPTVYTDPLTNMVEIKIMNYSQYPQPGLRIVITDNFKHHSLTKNHPKELPIGYDRKLLEKVNKETTVVVKIDKLEPFDDSLIYTTEAPTDIRADIKEIHLFVHIQRGARIENKKLIYKRYDNMLHQQWWELDNVDEIILTNNTYPPPRSKR